MAERRASIWEMMQLKGYSRRDFVRALREGTRPDGSQIDTIMPWRNTATMTDMEIDAIWEYVQTLTPVEAESAPSE